jgi:hypothetical protein
MSAAPKLKLVHSATVLSPMDGALKMARMGFAVIRLKPGTKVPVIGPSEATTDANTIMGWSLWDDVPNPNFGYLLGPDRVGIDCDAYKPGGAADRASLGPLPPTFRAQSPQGGEHIIFTISRQIGQQKLAPTIDVRTGVGYLVCPGSIIDGKIYTVLEDATPSPCPPHIDARLGQRVEHSKDDWVGGTCGDWRTKIPEQLWQRIRTEGRPDRSHHSCAVMLALFDCGLSDDDAMEVAEHEDARFAAKYVDRGDLRAEISRVRSMWRDKQQAPTFKEVEQYKSAAPKPAPSAVDQLVTQTASSIQPTAIEWVWPWRFALGKPNLLGGDMGLGKTNILIDIIARCTRGAEWPCGEGRAPKGSCIFMGTEDGLADTLVPRLMAAGADTDKVQFITAVQRGDGKGRRSFSLQTDLGRLEELITKLGDVVLVVIDPLNSYFGRGVDSYKAADIRSVLEPVSEMADRLRVTIIGNAHLSKDGKGKTRDANLRILDSQAIGAIARGICLVAPDPDNPGRALFMRSKNSNAPPGLPSLAYTIRSKVVGTDARTSKPIEGTYLDWAAEAVAVSANDVFGQIDKGGSRETPAQDSAITFLETLLAKGRVTSTAVKEAAEANCISLATLRRAKEHLGIEPKKEKGSMDGDWWWELPAARPPKLPGGF